MSIVKKHKGTRHSQLELELFRLRNLGKMENMSGHADLFSQTANYRGKDRDGTGSSLRYLWEIYRDASEFMDLLQRVYLAQTAYRFAAITEVMAADGELYHVTGALDPWRTHKPSQLGKFLSYSPELWNKQLLDDDTAEASMVLISEYCETLAQDNNPGVILSIHHPKLLANYHKSKPPAERWSMLSVNVDNEFTWAQRERPIYLRKAFTVEARGLSHDSLTKRVTGYQDNMRLLGEKLELYGCAYDRPALNIIVAVMQEVSDIIYKVRFQLQKVNTAIMKDVAQYKGFQHIGKNVLIEEPKQMRYAEGVTISNAVSPVQTRQIGSLKRLNQLRGLVHTGLLNVDTPRLAFRMKPRVAKLPRNPDYGPLWDKGRAALIKSVDPIVKKLIQTYRPHDPNSKAGDIADLSEFTDHKS